MKKRGLHVACVARSQLLCVIARASADIWEKTPPALFSLPLKLTDSALMKTCICSPPVVPVMNLVHTPNRFYYKKTTHGRWQAVQREGKNEKKHYIKLLLYCTVSYKFFLEQQQQSVTDRFRASGKKYWRCPRDRVWFESKNWKKVRMYICVKKN